MNAAAGTFAFAISHANGSGNAIVTLATGTYIMAGGGFKVTGAAQLHAPNVLLYNTNDTAQPTGNGAVEQIVLNTTGSVTVGPPDDRPRRASGSSRIGSRPSVIRPARAARISALPASGTSRS